MHRQSQKQPLKSLINAILQFTENSESNFPERAKELPWEMLLMDLSNNQNGGINLEAIKDENWFRFDEWSFPGRNFARYRLNGIEAAKLTKILINFIVSREIPLAI